MAAAAAVVGGGGGLAGETPYANVYAEYPVGWNLASVTRGVTVRGTITVTILHRFSFQAQGFWTFAIQGGLAFGFGVAWCRV